MTHTEYADSLRQIADWYGAHPEVPLSVNSTIQIYIVKETLEVVERLARALAPCEKKMDGLHMELFKLVRRFGALTLEFIFWRSTVCTKRVIGTVAVPQIVIPAHTKELVEWDCPESVLSHDPT